MTMADEDGSNRCGASVYVDAKISMDTDHVQSIKDERHTTPHSSSSNGTMVENLSSSSEAFDKSDHMELMAFENYSLRKRCKRLESIVTQLIHKGKSDPDGECGEGIQLGDTDSYSIKVNTSPYEDRSSPPSTYDKRMMPSKVSKPTFTIPIESGKHRVPSSVFQSKSDLYEQTPYSRRSSDYVSLDKPIIHIPSTFDRDKFSHHNNRSRRSPGGSADHRADKRSYGEKRHYPFDPKSKVSPPIKVKTENKSDDELSPEEMEKRNELFRATYYAHQERKSSSRESIPYDSLRIRRESPPYTRRDYIPIDRFPSRNRSQSPDINHNGRYHTESLSEERRSSSRDRNDLDRKYIPDLLRISSQQKVNDEPGLYYEPITRRNISYKEKYEPRIVPPPVKSAHIQPLLHNALTPHSHQLHSVPRISSAGGVLQTLPRVLGTDNDIKTNYNSEFYTKLPPKLHIVESQNENGVTLTWNATSNCDSSLVKSYQLFARELFGHKVGTMKRIGIVEALPLPMSCNIDKLKYNIKYKFAVCAVDIYGRFGKMSNFTGKFELKPKGPMEAHNTTTHQDIDCKSDLQIVV